MKQKTRTWKEKKKEIEIMMNIIEFFDNLYNNTTNENEWENVYEYEESVYSMKSLKKFENWARENNVDLTAVNEVTGIAVLQHWAWNWDE